MLNLANFPIAAYVQSMAETLNISLSPGQLAWVKSRKEQEAFASASDVIRELIRREQEKERSALATEFDRLDKDGAAGPEPVEEIVSAVRKVKKELRRHEADRGS